jgi:hypothetical protein
MKNASACSRITATEERIGACLKLFGDAVVPESPGRWQIKNANDYQSAMTVEVDQEWLIVERSLVEYPLTVSDDVRKWIWQLLDPARDMPSGARPVLVGEDGLARIRAERFIAPQSGDNNDRDLRDWIKLACSDVADATIHVLPPAVDDDSHNRTGGKIGVKTHGAKPDSVKPDVAIPHVAIQSDIAMICTLAGWPASTRNASNETVVPLPERNGGACHAIGTLTGTTVRFQTALDPVPTDDTSSACLVAIAIALLRVAGIVRLVRPTLTRAQGQIAAGFDVVTQAPPVPEQVDHALSSLTLARRQVAAECAVLATDETLATTYLTYQGLR